MFLFITGGFGVYAPGRHVGVPEGRIVVALAINE